MNDTEGGPCASILRLLDYVDGIADASHQANSSIVRYSNETNVIGGIEILEKIKFYLSTIVNPLLCIFGIVGNILNVFVLTRKRFQTALDCSHEQVAVIGLIALALSDSLYCFTNLPDAFIGRPKTVTRKFDSLFFYQVYGVGVKDYFIHTSNWLIVLMAVSRYMAICKPLHTRGLVSAKATIGSILFVFTFWVFLTLPKFWTHDIIHLQCIDEDRDVKTINVHVLDQGYFVRNKAMNLAFSYLWTLLGFFIPAVLLIYCNCHLIKSVRESVRLQTQYRVHSKRNSISNNITPTLVAVICMFLFTTSPSEILHFYYYNVPTSQAEGVSTAIVFFNVLLTVNYSMNFLLYCLVNPRFRETICHVMRCGPLGRITRRLSVTNNGSSKRHTQITYNTSNSNNHLGRGITAMHARMSSVKGDDMFRTFNMSSSEQSSNYHHGNLVKESEDQLGNEDNISLDGYGRHYYK